METGYLPIRQERIDELARKADAIGGHIDIVQAVHVYPGIGWTEAIERACPETPAPSRIWTPEVEEQYRSCSLLETTRDIVLLNFPKGDGGWDTAIAWSKHVSLRPTHPRDVFAVSEQYPHLDVLLDKKVLAVIPSSECLHRSNPCVPFVIWAGLGNAADLRLLRRVNSPDIWFSFYDREV